MLKLPFKDLLVWKKSVDLSLEIYKITKNFPKEEVYCLVSQMRRSSVSVPSNIAEGSQRNSNKDFSRFLLISKASLAELETQLIICKRMNYVSDNSFKKIISGIDELHRMLYALNLKVSL